MTAHLLRRLSFPVLALTAALGLAACSSTTTEATPLEEASPPAASVISDQSVVAHFDLAGGQLPENVIEAADGGVLVTFAASRQVVHVTPDGDTAVIATLPESQDASAATPVLGFPLTTGLERDGDDIYALLATGADDTTGVWKMTADSEPRMIAALPSNGLPNGLALDTASDTLFVTDSVLGVIYTVPTSGGTPTVWSDDEALSATGFLGVNGLKLRDGALFASNLDLGTILQIPLNDDGTAGKVEMVASDLVGIDDFDFTDNGDEIIAAINPDNEVVLIQEDGTHSVVLNEGDGLSNPTSALVFDDRLYVASAAYVTQEDPNLLVATISSE